MTQASSSAPLAARDRVDIKNRGMILHGSLRGQGLTDSKAGSLVRPNPCCLGNLRPALMRSRKTQFRQAVQIAP
jgi:hypothetical protein